MPPVALDARFRLARHKRRARAYNRLYHPADLHNDRQAAESEFDHGNSGRKRCGEEIRQTNRRTKSNKQGGARSCSTNLQHSAAVASVAASGAVAEPSGVFRQSHELGYGSNSSLDPISLGRVFQITEKIMNRLIRPGLDGRPAADLAVSWTSNEDSTEWIFNLRTGVKFHDGTDFDAEDVLYSLGRVQDPELDSPAASTIKMVSSIEALDSHTVKMMLSAPFGDLPLQLMDYRLRIIPEGSGDTIASTGIGTGPFKVDSFDPMSTTVLSANMEYWEGPPGVAGMEIIGIPDAQARLQALLGGQIDMLHGVTSQQTTMLENSDKFNVQEVRTGDWRAIVFRTDTDPFTDQRVRKSRTHRSRPGCDGRSGDGRVGNR